jgi:hypothetical protein
VVGSRCVKGALRHVGKGGVVWVLDYGHAAGLANRGEARAAVAECTSQDDRDNPGTVFASTRLEEGIDGWLDSVHARRVQEPDSAILNHQVVPGWGDQDAPRLQRAAVPRLRCSQASGLIKDLRKGTRGIGWMVEQHDDRRWEVFEKASDESTQSFDSARGRADGDEAVCQPVAGCTTIHSVQFGHARRGPSIPRPGSDAPAVAKYVIGLK